jgi:hypothetical protein
MVVQELDVEQRDALSPFRWRSRRSRADANGKGSEDENRGKPPCSEAPREQTVPPAKAPPTAGA